MSSYKLASRYAKSLIDLAIERGQLEEVNQDMNYANEVIKSSRPFRVFLRAAVIKPEVKQRVIDQLFGKKFSEITKSFFALMIRKRREEYLPDIVEQFTQQYYEHKNITPVYFTTAAPVSDEVLKRITDLFLQTTHVQEIVMNNRVNKNLVGGFRFRYHDRLYDASIRHHLEKMDDMFQQNLFVKQ